MVNQFDFSKVVFAKLPSKKLGAGSAMLLTSIKQIEKRTFPTNEAFHFDSELPKRTTNLYCAYLPGPKGTFKIYGYTVYVRSKLVTRIHKVCVVEEQRGKGIGKWMVGLVLRDLKKGGSTTVDLWVDESRDAAWKLYLSCGFQRKEVVQDYYSPGRHGIRMEAELTDPEIS